MRDKYGVVPVLVSHGLCDHTFELPALQRDRETLQTIGERLSRDGKVFFLQGDYNSVDLVTVYSAFAATVSTRLHVGILSACGGTPSILVAYEPTKTYGIAQMMGLDDYVVALRDLDAAGLTEVVERLWLHRSELRRRLLAETLPGLRMQLAEYGRLTLHGLGA